VVKHTKELHLKPIYNILGVISLISLISACSEPPQEQALVEVTEPETVLFLCPHGAAKSVLASAYFEKLSAEKGLRFQGASAGTEPDAVTAPVVVNLLKDEGIEVSDRIPRLVTNEELSAAYRVISMGCDLGEMAPAGVAVEEWDIPDFSADVPTARSAIYAHVECLVDDLSHKESSQ
jgi:arsenate reductase (thioredoxin)